jgi:hypothetical protein
VTNLIYCCNMQKRTSKNKQVGGPGGAGGWEASCLTDTAAADESAEGQAGTRAGPSLAARMNADTAAPRVPQHTCRKKYCDQCLMKFYHEKPPARRPDSKFK